MSPVFALLLLRGSVRPPQPIDGAKIWQKVEQSIRSRYYARAAQKEKMEALLKKFSVPASAANTPEAFEAAVNQMIAEFGDSHFSFLSNEDQGFYLMDSLSNAMKGKPMPNIGAWFAKNPAGWELTMCLDGLAAQKAGLRKGDIIQTADGSPFLPIESLTGKSGKTVTLGYLRDGQPKQAKVSVSEDDALAMFYEASRNSERIIEDHGKKMAYIHIWTMANPRFASLLNGWLTGGKGSECDGVIYDIRDGFGGRPEGFYEPLFSPHVAIHWITGNYKVTQYAGFDRPAVLLVNRGSRSAKEVVSEIFAESHRATLVGSTTAGNVLGTSPYKVSDWAFLEIPMVDVDVSGIRLEGKGVAPEVEVQDGFDSTGMDKVLQAGIETLRKKLKASP